MVISDKHRFIFIHNPKTGGESIEAALTLYASLLVSAPKNLHKRLNKHSNPKMIKKYVGETIWNSYFKFVFVRNPWDRFLSLYMYARSRKPGLRAQRLSFEEYLKYRMTHNKQFLVQRSYVNLNINFIGRFERLNADFKNICKVIGISCTLPHKNKSVHEHYRKYYTENTKNLVATFSKVEIDRFGYAF